MPSHPYEQPGPAVLGLSGQIKAPHQHQKPKPWADEGQDQQLRPPRLRAVDPWVVTHGGPASRSPTGDDLSQRLALAQLFPPWADEIRGADPGAGRAYIILMTLYGLTVSQEVTRPPTYWPLHATTSG